MLRSQSSLRGGLLRACGQASSHGGRAALNATLTTRKIKQMNHLTPLQTRSFSFDTIPAILTPPAIFLGLLVTLWTYKCTMTVIFQDRIIYMPYMPPFARGEKLEDWTKECAPVEWSTLSIRSLDDTKISLCVGRIPGTAAAKRKVVVCYFHGNGASLPPRLPMLSNNLKAVHSLLADDVDITLVALSYRGYWTSSGRASEAGIRKDAQAMLRWVCQTYGRETELILWGQSIGAGVACAAAAETNSPIRGLILETPFTSIKSMLIALYPQKWLPYQYLWPFLWNHWDNESALHAIAARQPRPEVLLLVAKRDEVVPPEEADKIESILKGSGFDATRINIFGSLHTEATTRREGQKAVAEFISNLLHKD